MRRYLTALGLAALALGGSACDEKLSTLAGPTPNLEPTFTSIQRDIFHATDSAGRAACVGCHTATGRTPSGGMNLDSAVAYDQIVNVPSRERPDLMRIAPGNPDASYLLHKIEGRSGITGRRMPFNPPYLKDGQILILRRWIEIGAPRN
jgi:hypothetical protein